MANYKKLKNLTITLDSESNDKTREILLPGKGNPEMIILQAKRTIEKIIFQTVEFKPIIEFEVKSQSFVIDFHSIGTDMFILTVVFSGSEITKSLLYI